MNLIKDRLKEGLICYGTMMQFSDPGIAEVLSNAGYSWIAADMEHSDINVAGFAAICRGMYGRGAVPLARVRENDTLAIRQVLDMGASGVIVPLIGSAEEARKAVSAARHPPEGIRGFSFHRANDYGADFDNYVRESNQDTLVIVMIESRSGVENIEEILEVDGVDGIYIGPYDMSGSYGVVGQIGHPLVSDAVSRCGEACRRTGKAAGIHIAHPTRDLIEARKAEGFTLIGLGYDSLFLDKAARSALELTE